MLKLADYDEPQPKRRRKAPRLIAGMHFCACGQPMTGDPPQCFDCGLAVIPFPSIRRSSPEPTTPHNSWRPGA